MNQFLTEFMMSLTHVVREAALAHIHAGLEMRKDLVALVALVGHPYVPGEDLRAYRRRIVTLRDEDPHRFAGEEAAR